jgi:hypothetical protein
VISAIGLSNHSLQLTLRQLQSAHVGKPLIELMKSTPSRA